MSDNTVRKHCHKIAESFASLSSNTYIYRLQTQITPVNLHHLHSYAKKCLHVLKDKINQWMNTEESV